MDKPKIILVLVHQGFSHLDDIQRFAQQFGFAVSALSSAPSVDGAPIYGQADDLSSLTILDQPSLDWDVVKEEVIRLKREFMLSAVISSYEGYRVLMAKSNEYSQIRDCSPQAILGAMDKLNLRVRLNEAGLSNVKSSLLSQSTLANLNFLPKQFIKPRFGINSFGCFSSENDVLWSDIVELQEKIKSDQFLKTAFFNSLDFIIEDYINGTEFSFEVLAVNGQYYVLGVHEKVELQEVHKTVLETLDVSPPISINDSVLNSGKDFLTSVLKCLNLDQGVFHIEARWDQASNKWEVIEVNPRMGGGLIDESVQALNDGGHLMDLWLMSLMEDAEIIEALIKRLHHVDEYKKDKFTVSAYCFGEPGKLINAMIERKPKFAPIKLADILTIGDYIPNLNREVPIKEAMWVVERQEVTSLLDELKLGWVDVKYVDPLG